MSLSHYRRRYRSAKSVLQAASALIERGWTKGQNRTDRGDQAHFCSNGAIQYVARTHENAERALSILNAHIPTGGKNTYANAIDYNDAEGTRKAQVLRVFKKAIASA